MYFLMKTRQKKFAYMVMGAYAFFQIANSLLCVAKFCWSKIFFQSISNVKKARKIIFCTLNWCLCLFSSNWQTLQMFLCLCEKTIFHISLFIIHSNQRNSEWHWYLVLSANHDINFCCKPTFRTALDLRQSYILLCLTTEGGFINSRRVGYFPQPGHYLQPNNIIIIYYEHIQMLESFSYDF